MLKTYSSPTSFRNSTSPATVHHVKQITHSILQKALVGPTARRSSRAGRTLTSLPYPLGRWAQVLVIWPWTMPGADGIGRRSWEWVFTSFLAIPTSAADVVLGELLLRSLLKALLTKEKHAAENKKFDTVFSADLRQEWTVMIRNWEHDKSKPNPYTHTEKGILTPRLSVPCALTFS